LAKPGREDSFKGGTGDSLSPSLSSRSAELLFFLNNGGGDRIVDSIDTKSTFSEYKKG